MTWMELQKKLRKVKTEADALALLEEEKAGKNRPRHVSRIYSRYARLRRLRENRELEKAS